MRRFFWTTAVVATILLVVAFLINAAFRDRVLAPETPKARLERLAPHWRLVSARTEGRSPVAILLSGCDGPGDGMDYWATALAEMGWASLVLDSHTPRGFDRLQGWRLVCSGQALSGAERAGDVAVALAALGAMDEVDGDRVILLGASHGGWAVMELIDRLGREALPPGLSAWPEPREVAAGRRWGAVLLYPYCGELNRTAEEAPANTAIPILMVLAGEDTIVSAARCEEVAVRLARERVNVQVETLPGVDHGFDQRAHRMFSTLDFDADATAKATEIVSDFLTTLATQSMRTRPRRPPVTRSSD